MPSLLKIENWGNLFMQRLNNLSKKDEYCDYTIYSHSNESFNVHRVVLNTCSDYFFSHPNNDTSMIMPAHLDFNAVKSVIMFMYTGQLHHTKETRMSLLEVADMLQVTILLKLLQSGSSTSKNPTKDPSPQASTSKTHSAIALNQYRPAKKPVHQTKVRSPPDHMPASTFINTMKVKDVLTSNKPMRFDCDVEDVPEFIENTFELPKYDSAPLIKQDTIDNARALLKRTSNGELVNTSYKTQQDITKCKTEMLSSPSGKKFKIVSDTEPENSNNKVVQSILKKFPYLSQEKGNIPLKIMSSHNQNQFESIVIINSNSVEKILPAGSDVQTLTYKVKPDITDIKGPWRNVHQVEEMTSSSATKELLISVIDTPRGSKILSVNKGLDKIEEVLLNDNDVLNQKNKQTKDSLGKNEIAYSEQVTDVEPVTLEDATQVDKDKQVKSKLSIDITDEWDDIDEGDVFKKEESDREDDLDKPCRIEL